MKSPIPAVLALFLPLVVLGGGASLVGSYEPERPAGAARELANAGRVMNGRRLNQGVVEQMERELNRSEPTVLIIGNSYANTNIQPKLIARALDVPPKKVKLLSVPNSVGSHWYAILKNRVYRNGHRPPLVIVVSPLQSMLLTEPYSEASYANLTVQLDDTEPLLDKRVQRSAMVWRQLRQRRGAVRDGLLERVRDAAIGLFYPSDLLQEENEAALGRVFHDSNIDMERFKNALPVVETRDGGLETGPGAVPHPRDSMLPALAQLAKDNGSRLLFIRSPMAPRTPENELDAVPDGWEEATWEVLHESGHLLADLSLLPMQDALFHNPGHMTDEGAKHFTKVLLEALDDPLSRKKTTPPVSYELFGNLELQGGRLHRDLPQTHYAADPPPVPDPERVPELSRRRAVLGAIDAADLDAISDARTLPVTPTALRCSPIRVLEDGAVLPRHHEACSEGKKGPAGRVCHGPKKRIVLMSSDGSPVKEHRYSLALDSERDCGGGRWLYPSDVLTLAIGPEIRERFATGPGRLALTATGMGSDGLLVASVWIEGVEQVRDALPLADGLGTTVSLALPEGLPRSGAVELRIENPGDGFALVTSGLLTER